jgi:hypothetical protein
MATTAHVAPTRTTVTRLPRTTGALSGLLVILLGVWGALIPFIGPYFHYAFGSFHTWHYSANRLWLDIIPGALAVLGGLLLLRSRGRTGGLIGGWLAVAAGAWFAVGQAVFLFWHHAINPIGRPMGGYTRQALEQVGYFYGLGALIVALAAFAMGRYYSRPRLIEEPLVAAEDAVAAHEASSAADRPVVARRAGVREPVAADEPVAAREDPVVADRDAPVTGRGNAPVTAREEPVAAREAEDPVGRDAPVTAVPTRDEPLTARDEPLTARDEPLTSREAPLATAPATSARTASSSGGRRPGLLRRLRG